jgi:ABC-type Fe3+-hydroxamate transport system substrate-binding protein
LTGGSPALAVAVVLALVACRTDPAVASGAVAVVEDAGDTVTLRVPARRIVSLIPSTTEILVTAGLEHRVVGRSEWCDWPADTAGVARRAGNPQPAGHHAARAALTLAGLAASSDTVTLSATKDAP